MPAINRRLVTQSDLQDAMERQIGVRVFENNHIAESGGSHPIRRRRLVLFLPSVLRVL